MTVLDITEAKAVARVPSKPRRHAKWRNDWKRTFYAASYDSDYRRWDVHPIFKVARYYPSRAAFDLEYEYGLLRYIKFVPRLSEAPAIEWEQTGPEMRELVSQIKDLYLYWG